MAINSPFQESQDSSPQDVASASPTSYLGPTGPQEISSGLRQPLVSFNDIDIDALEISPELFEAVANLEPLSARVAALDEQNW